jgi:ubiquinone/menaquinone biosynthesis C-methylase UbiE
MDYEKIYAEHAEQYDALVSAEDCDHHLLPALEQIVRLKGADVLEVGVGTGRLSRLIAPIARRMVGVERSPAMLAVARRHLTAADNCTLCLGDACALPVHAGWADVAIAGWVFGHFRYWLEANWRESITSTLQQMQRALKPDGTLILIETLGTGNEEPAPPSPELAEYYDWLEREKKFARRAIRTDYAFESVERAAEVTGFFFGADFAKRVREEQWSRVPECTGIWVRSRVSS